MACNCKKKRPLAPKPEDETSKKKEESKMKTASRKKK